MLAHPTRQKLSFEQVEDRRLMSTSPWLAGPAETESQAPQAEIQTIAGSHAVLTIQGTDADEQINIEPVRRGGLIRVQVIDLAEDEVTLEQSFPRRQPDAIQVNANGGNDRVIQSTRLPATINGGDGNDGLYSRSESELIGDAGSDRFLIAHSRLGGETGTPLDQETGEVQIHLHDGGHQSVKLNSGHQGSWAHGRFRSHEVALLDGVFAELQEATGNQRLLETARGTELHFHRHGRQLSGDPIGAWKAGANNIHLTAQTFVSDAQARQIILHAIGHNWDDPEEHSLVSDFRAESGWRLASDADGIWEYDTDSTVGFARAYGLANPMEDFATSFAAYFMDEEYPGDGFVDVYGPLVHQYFRHRGYH